MVYIQYNPNPCGRNVGEAGAKSYMVAPNTTVTLWDSEAQVIYLKSADALGRPSMKIIDYTIREDSPFGALTASQNDFSLKNEVDTIKKDIEALKERVASMTRQKIQSILNMMD